MRFDWLAIVMVLVGIASCRRTQELPARPDPSSRAPAPTSSSSATIVASTPPRPTSTEPPLRKRHRTAPIGARRGPHPTDFEELTKSLNPATKDGYPIFAKADDTCFYETPVYVAPGTFPPMGWRGRDRHPIDCPASMDDPVWDECAPGELTQDPAHGRCACQIIDFVMGPSTPWFQIDCPKR